MTQLTDTLQYDEKLTLDEQANEVKDFINNVMHNYSIVTGKEKIPMSDLNRKTEQTATLENGVVITQIIKYKKDKANAGWAEVKSIKTTVNG